jgi:hypothetical protein
MLSDAGESTSHTRLLLVQLFNQKVDKLGHASKASMLQRPADSTQSSQVRLSGTSSKAVSTPCFKGQRIVCHTFGKPNAVVQCKQVNIDEPQAHPKAVRTE